MQPVELRISIKTCTACGLSEKGTLPVPWSGDAPLAIIGEAPGETEDKQGKPFVGPAGQLLRRAIDRVFGEHPSGEKVSDYLSYLNVVCCYPSRTPRASEVKACQPNLEAQLAILKPAYAVIVGGVALGAFLPSQARRTRPDGSVVPPASLTSLRGKWLLLERDWGHCFALVTWHPSAVLREGGLGVGKGREMLSDLETWRDAVYLHPEIQPAFLVEQPPRHLSLPV